VHWAKGRGEASKASSLTLVAMGVLEKDGATSSKEIKGESNTSARSVKGSSSTTLDFSGWSRPQVVFKSSCHLWLSKCPSCALKELVGGHNLKWSSSLHVTFWCMSAQAEPWKELVGGHDLKWSSSVHVTCGCPSAQVGIWKELVGGYGPKWSSSLHITCGHAGSQDGH